jgi:hypothetical protein
VTIFGWDMSHYDDVSIGDAVGAGIGFITHKAGGDADDQELAAWWSGVRGLDPGTVLLGAYWVLYPGSPETRADAFIARLDATCPGWRERPFILQVDCEIWGGDKSTLPPRADVQAFCDRLRAVMPRLRPIVYGPKWCYGDALLGLGYPLWASSYVSGPGGFLALYPGDDSSRWAAYSGQTPAILQYSSSATVGGQTTSDVNAYRGTLPELTALVAPGWTEGDDGTATISQSDFNDRMDGWWIARMDPAAADNKPRTFLRLAVGGKAGTAEPAESVLAGLTAVPVTDIAKVLEMNLSPDQLDQLRDALATPTSP